MCCREIGERVLNDRIKKIMTWRPDKKLVAAGAILGLILLLLPLFRVALYSAPWYDDYNYGRFAKEFLEEERSLVSAIRGAWYCTRTSWYAWQGTFSSIFFMSMVPSVWGDQYYFWGPLFLLCILLIAIFVLTKILLRDVLGAEWSFCLAVQAIVAAMVFEFIYTPNGGFFWYNAGVHYVGMHSFLLLLTAAWIKLLKGTGKVSRVLLLLWTLMGAVLAGGANFVTTLQGLLVGLSLVALGILLKNKRTFLMLPSVAVYLAAFWKNVSAPGNAVRKNVLGDMGMDPAEAIGHSFLEAFRHIPEFTGLITVAVMILLLPIVWQMGKKLTFQFRFPGLLLLWSFCLYATGFTPSLYSLGHAGLGRTMNAVKITFQLLLIINEVYWLGWIQKKLRDRDKFFDRGAIWWFYPIMGALMLCIFAVEPHQSAKYSSFAAYYYVHTGEAYNFHQEYLNRLETIVNGGSDVVVTPYVYRPWILQSSDLSSSPEGEANRAMAAWYHKNSITCIAQDSE